MSKKFNERLKDLREDHDMLQKEVAEKIGCATYSYQRYEYGEKMIPMDKLIKLAELYKTSTDYILGLTDNKTPYPKKGLTTSRKENITSASKTSTL